MVESIVKALSAGLSLWQSKEKRKYQDKLIRLKREYYEEYNKPENDRDHAALDRIEFELQLLCEAFYSQVGTQTTLDSSK